MVPNYCVYNIYIYVYIFFLLENFEYFFEIYVRMENVKQPNYKNESIDTKHLNNKKKTDFQQ